MKHIIELIVQLLTSWGLPANVATNLSITILFIGLTILIYIIDVVLKKIIRATFTKIAHKSKTDFDDIMLANRVPSSMAQIVPFILPYKTHFGGSFNRTKPELRGGYYVHLAPQNESFIATGFWDPNKEDLLRIRKEFETDSEEIRVLMEAPKFKSVWGTL
ncbi:DUF2461 domain-containing protein, partial [Flavobacteriaceae bacterium]|nr:DUF2461 domain-containing protein [Flavobacteriaceae bacterium]